MLFYTGNTSDGSNAKEFKGFHVSKCGNYFGSTQEDADSAWKMDIPETRKERRSRLRKNLT